MPFVDGTCKNCGAKLLIDSNLKTAYCSHCGTPYIVEQAINMTAKGAAEKERLIENAKTYHDIGELSKAGIIYEQIIEDYPSDYRGWYGLASIETVDFTYAGGSHQWYANVKKLVSRALHFSDPNSKASIERDIEQLTELRNAFLSNKRAEYGKLKGDLENKAKELQLTIENECLAIESERSKLDEKEKTVSILRNRWYKLEQRCRRKALFVVPLVLGICSILTTFILIECGCGADLWLWFLIPGMLVILLALFIKKYGKRAEKEAKTNYDNQVEANKKLSDSLYQHNNRLNQLNKELNDVKHQIDRIKEDYSVYENTVE